MDFTISLQAKTLTKFTPIGLCRGDVKPEICRSCLSSSSQDINNLCPTQKEAIVWYDNCLLRYSNRSIFGRMEIGPYFWMYNTNNVSNPAEFNQAVISMLGNLTSKAASGDSHLKFATGNTTTASSQTIFALVQCTPDLSMKDCTECLTNTTKLLPRCCDGRQGGRVLGPSCNFRYEKEQFYDVIPPDAPSPSSPSPTPVSSSPPPPSTSPQVPQPPQSTQVSPPPSMNAATTKGKQSNIFIAAITLVSVLFM